MNIFQTLCNFFTVLLIGLSLTFNSTNVSANYRYFIDSESVVERLNDTFPSVIPSYIQEQYGQLVPESSSLGYPESTVVITGLAVASVVGAGVFAGSVGFVGANSVTTGAIGIVSGDVLVSVATVGAAVFQGVAIVKISSVEAAFIAAFLSAVGTFSISSFSAAFFEDSPVYDFYTNRIEYHFTLKDKENQITPGSCLIYFGSISEHGLEYERDACYIKAIPSQQQIYAGQEDYTLVKIPQTEDGRVRVGGWTHLDDWIQGQTKVVDTGFIPRGY